MKETILDLISAEIKLDKEQIRNLVEIPPTLEMGDYAFPVFSLAKELKKNPIEIAKELAESIRKKLPEEISGVDNKGPYLNFFIDKKMLAEKVLIETKKKNWGKLKTGKRKVLIEFSQPNTHKAFHVGHIRGTSLGESLARIFENCEDKVTRVNYSGDTGMHIAKWIWCYKKFHQNENLKGDESWIASIYVDAVKRLTENESLQSEVDEINRRIETKEDNDINELWKKTRELSIESWNKIYHELGTKFDKHYFESQVELPGKEISLELLKRGIAKKDDGATIMDLKEYNLSVWVLLRKDDTVLYSAKDLALAKRKFEEFPSDYYLVTVGDEQTLHFKQLQKTLELMKEKDANKYDFLPFGMVRFPTGKMSSRTGQNILYSDFIKEVKSIAREKIKETTNLNEKEIERRSLIASIAAIKYSMLKQDPRKTIIFDPHSDVSFEGDTGPYLLYSYARANSIIKKVKSKKTIKIVDLKNSEIKLIKKIEEFPIVIQNAYEKLSPNIIANYSFDLAQIFNEFYHNCPVMGSIEEGFRVKLVDAFRVTIKKALELLGIEVLEEM